MAVINERGGPLASIKEVNVKAIKSNHVYLDNLTGDYYSYSAEKEEWKPLGNVGLHYSRAMASFGGAVGGDLVKKVSTYQSKTTDMKA